MSRPSPELDQAQQQAESQAPARSSLSRVLESKAPISRRAALKGIAGAALGGMLSQLPGGQHEASADTTPAPPLLVNSGTLTEGKEYLGPMEDLFAGIEGRYNLPGIYPHAAEAVGEATRRATGLVMNLEAARFNFNADFDVDPETQIENIRENIKEARKLSFGALSEIQQTVGAEVGIVGKEKHLAPMLTPTSEEYARFVLVHPDDERPFQNMAIDRYPETDMGGLSLEMQGLYLGRVSRPVETSIGTWIADIGVNYRWMGGDGESEERTEIIEPFWLGLRNADGSLSNYAVVMELDGHFPYPMNVAGFPDANGILVARALDDSIGIQASNMGFGDARPAQDFSQYAVDNGFPVELYTKEAVQATIDNASKYFETYKAVTLAQAEKDGYVIKYLDTAAPPGVDITETNITKVFKEIPDIDPDADIEKKFTKISSYIENKLTELPNYEDYLTPGPIIVDELFPLLRPTTVAVSPYKVAA